MLGECEVCGKKCVGKDGKKYKRCFDHKETQVPQPVQEQIKDEYQDKQNYWEAMNQNDLKKNNQVTRLALLNTATTILTHNKETVAITASEVIKLAEELEGWVKKA